MALSKARPPIAVVPELHYSASTCIPVSVLYMPVYMDIETRLGVSQAAVNAKRAKG